MGCPGCTLMQFNAKVYGLICVVNLYKALNDDISLLKRSISFRSFLSFRGTIVACNPSMGLHPAAYPLGTFNF